MAQYSDPSPFAEALLLHFLIAFVLGGEKPPWFAEPRFELGPALHQANALPTKLRCTLFYPIYHIEEMCDNVPLCNCVSEKYFQPTK